MWDVPFSRHRVVECELGDFRLKALMTDRNGVGFTFRQRTDLVTQVVGTDTVAIAR